MATLKVFQVVDGPLSVRADPGGQWLKSYPNGTQLEVDAGSRTESGGYVWWQHSEGWSAEKALDGSHTFLQEVAQPATAAASPAAADASAMSSFAAAPKVPEPAAQVVTLAAKGMVRIRDAARLTGNFIRWLADGEQIETDLSKQVEADGYVWVQHKEGWSAMSSLDGRQVYLVQVTATAATPATQSSGTTADASAMASFAGSTAGQTAAKPAESTASDTKVDSTASDKVATASKGKKDLQAAQDVRVRSKPSLSGAHIKWISAGTVVTFDLDSQTDADGYVWLHHDEGWSAWKNDSGSEVYLVEPGSVANVPVMTDNGPDVTTLPNYKTLVTRFPVDLGNTAWWQYFGNNVYAFEYGASWGYDRYAQALHSGLDFGNNNGGISAYAGLNCTFSSIDRYGIHAKVGPYSIIWQHLTNIPSFTPGQQFTPDTKVGELDPSSPRLRHLHFEIRYKGIWIVSPLHFMSDDMVNAIIAKFDPKRPGNTHELYYFYKDATWNQWITPLDQPVIKLGGPVIGPLSRNS